MYYACPKCKHVSHGSIGRGLGEWDYVYYADYSGKYIDNMKYAGRLYTCPNCKLRYILD
jgi:hypothetical protein